MSSLTRTAASSFSLVTAPIISVLTGPADGKVSIIVSLWNRTAASVNNVEYTPHAPFHGSVRSSYFMPSTSRPLTYICAHSWRLLISVSTCSHSSEANCSSSLSLICSARLAANGTPLKSSSSGIRSIVIPSIPISISSGSPISISITGASPSSISSSSSVSPSGACVRLGFILLVAI